MENSLSAVQMSRRWTLSDTLPSCNCSAQTFRGGLTVQSSQSWALAHLRRLNFFLMCAQLWALSLYKIQQCLWTQQY